MDEKKTPAKGGVLSAEELAAFSLQLSYPVKAGVSAAECIGLMLEETNSEAEKAILAPVYDQLLAGEPLAVALEKTGKFPNYMIQMLSIGQISGNLDKVLDGLVGYYNKEAQRQASIKRAVTGPAVMLGVMAVLIVVLITQVLPVFDRVFRQMGTELSPIALSLVNAGNGIRIAMIAIGAILAALAVGALISSRGKEGSNTMSRLADKIFFRGRLSLTMGRARFASAMSLMVSGGLDLDHSLGEAMKLLKGSELESAVASCRKDVSQGESFPLAAQKAGIFTGMMSGILSAGFKAGSFDNAIAELAERSQKQSEEMLERFILRIEPALIVVLSVSVGLVLLSVMLPLISMLSSVGI